MNINWDTIGAFAGVFIPLIVLIWNMSRKITNHDNKIKTNQEDIKELKDTKAEKEVLEEIKSTVNKTDDKVQAIYEHLLSK